MKNCTFLESFGQLLPLDVAYAHLFWETFDYSNQQFPPFFGGIHPFWPFFCNHVWQLLISGYFIFIYFCSFPAFRFGCAGWCDTKGTQTFCLFAYHLFCLFFVFRFGKHVVYLAFLCFFFLVSPPLISQFLGGNIFWLEKNSPWYQFFLQIFVIFGLFSQQTAWFWSHAVPKANQYQNANP